MILSSCSEFFAKILKQNPHPHPLVYLQGVRFKDLELLKQFMYLGSAKVHFDEIQSFMDLSQRFLNQHSEEVPSKALESVKQEECENMAPLSTGTTNQLKTKKVIMKKVFSTSIHKKAKQQLKQQSLLSFRSFFLKTNHWRVKNVILSVQVKSCLGSICTTNIHLLHVPSLVVTKC